MADKQLALVVTPSGKKLLFETIARRFPTPSSSNKAAKAKAQADALSQRRRNVRRCSRNCSSAADGQFTHLAIGLRIEDDASLRLAARVLFVPGGELAAWSKDVKLPAEGLLSGVPAGKFAVAYGGVSAPFSKETWELFSRFTDMGMQMIGMDEEGRRKLQKLTEQLQAGKRFTGGMMGMMRPGDTLFSTAMAVEHVKNADEHFKATRANVRADEERAAGRQKGRASV